MWQISEIFIMFDTQFGFSVCHPLGIINVQHNVKIIADHNLIRYLPERNNSVCNKTFNLLDSYFSLPLCQDVALIDENFSDPHQYRLIFYASPKILSYSWILFS